MYRILSSQMTFSYDALLEWIDPINPISVLVAFICGAIIGFERQVSGKPAGMRTSVLITLGTYCFVALSTSIQGDAVDSSRVLGQIVTGIGFFGAGIMFNNGALVRGITSAAVIWILAATGSLIGFERYGAAIAITIVTLLVLVGISYIERKSQDLRSASHEE